MSAILRIVSGVASIGTGITLYRVVSLLWPIDPISALVVFFSLALMALIQVNRALTGESFPA